MPPDARSSALPFGDLARMGAFGFASGLPLPLSIFTLQQWLVVSGLSTAATGRVAVLGLPYSLKFLWSPLFDRDPPLGLARFGRRRGWLFIVQPALGLSGLLLAAGDPARNVAAVAASAALLAFFSASQDILIDAWRIETYAPDQQGQALAAYIWGYRAALLTSGSGAIYLSTRIGWHSALAIMALLMGAGLVITILAPEKPRPAAPSPAPPLEAFRRAFLAPLLEFLRRRGAVLLLAFIVLFRLGKVFADGNAAAYYRYALHFSSGTVAAANFLPSLLGTLAGAALGGWLAARFGNRRALLLAGMAQAASLGLYLALLATGPWAPMLYLKVGGEAFAAAAADTCFLAFLSTLTATAFTATQYALLSSVAALVFHTIGGASGDLAQALGFPAFYAVTIVASLPALILLLALPRVEPAAE